MIYPEVEKHLKEQHKTPLDLSNEIGVPKSTLYAKLAGNSEITLALASKIKKALGYNDDVEKLFSTTDPTPAA